mmetsp:Transcript_10131/g.14862  ORF Transcript_10131/g.14862 Transcript_10131/m.14862 type:complete len:81 (+) Transcript_10131:23-265(+)
MPYSSGLHSLFFSKTPVTVALIIGAGIGLERGLNVAGDYIFEQNNQGKYLSHIEAEYRQKNILRLNGWAPDDDDEDDEEL